MMATRRLMSGMRPTGRLHIGNLVGALDNWKRLQHEYACFFSVVDWHALTTSYDEPEPVGRNTGEMVMDWISAGIDPARNVLYRQSDVKEIAELYLLLGMITPVPWLERCPTYKDQVKQFALQGRDVATYGFLGYPLLQAADILMFRAEVVPVGEDQLPHLELTREIARRFNHLYGTKLFPEPQAILGEVALVPGIDGRKMSKSYGNEVEIAAPPEEIERRVANMITDPARIRRGDPGHPEVCSVYALHKVFSRAEVPRITGECQAGDVGCVECKKRLARAIQEALAPVREKRKELERHPQEIEEILRAGARRAREVARMTMEEVRRVMRI